MAIKQTIPCPEAIITLREAKGITKSEMAKRIGVSRRQYFEIEEGRMTWAELKRVTEELGINVLFVYQYSGK